jgi:hypothetical protein
VKGFSTNDHLIQTLFCACQMHRIEITGMVPILILIKTMCQQESNCYSSQDRRNLSWQEPALYSSKHLWHDLIAEALASREMQMLKTATSSWFKMVYLTKKWQSMAVHELIRRITTTYIMLFTSKMNMETVEP